jgi:hypothetical protein
LIIRSIKDSTQFYNYKYGYVQSGEISCQNIHNFNLKPFSNGVYINPNSYIEARCKIPNISSHIWPAFWLHNTMQNNDQQEIDIFEYFWNGNYTDATISPTTINTGWQVATHGSNINNCGPAICDADNSLIDYKYVDITTTISNFYNDFHTWGCFFTDSLVSFYLDGKFIYSTTVEVPNEPMRIVFTNSCANGAIYTSNADLEIDYVRVYSTVNSGLDLLNNYPKKFKVESMEGDIDKNTTYFMSTNFFPNCNYIITSPSSDVQILNSIFGNAWEKNIYFNPCTNDTSFIVNILASNFPDGHSENRTFNIPLIQHKTISSNRTINNTVDFYGNLILENSAQLYFNTPPNSLVKNRFNFKTNTNIFLKDSSTFILDNSEINCNNNCSITFGEIDIENGSQLLLTNSSLIQNFDKIVIHSGGILNVDSSSNIEISNNSIVEIEFGGKLILGNGNVVFNGGNSRIEVKGTLEVPAGVNLTMNGNGYY